MKKLVLAAAFAAFAMSAHAQTPPNATTKKFVQNAAISDMFEIQSSQIAMKKSNNTEVDQFAQKMVTDHTRTTNELKQMVQDMKGIELPTKLDSKHQKKLDKLRSATDARFHQQFRKDQIEGHKAAVELFTQYSNNGRNAELKQWAQKTLPHLKEHLKLAQSLPQGSPAPNVGANPARSGSAPASAPKR